MLIDIMAVRGREPASRSDHYTIVSVTRKDRKISTAKTTTNHDEIRKWVAKRGQREPVQEVRVETISEQLSD
jgi:hypothetical protein